MSKRTFEGRRWPIMIGLVLGASLAAAAPAPSVPSVIRASPAAALQQEGAEPDSEAQPRKRILHLAGGQTVRAIARRSATGSPGDWEYKKQSEWAPIPAAAVERVVLEADLMKEVRERGRAVDKRDAGARARLGAWMLDEGLLLEGLAELDAALAIDPDDPAAREAATASAHRFAVPGVEPDAQVPAGCDELLRFGAKGTPSLREMALVQLGRVRDREGLQRELARELFDSSVNRRSFATLALRRLFPGEEVRPLLHRAVLDASESVRVGAARALHDVGEPSLVLPVVKALDSSSQRVRVQAAEALGHMGYPAAVPALVSHLASLQGSAGHAVPHSYIFVGRQFAYIQDFDVEVAQFQAVADPQVNVLIEGQVTETGVSSVKEVSYVTERATVQGSLQRLTGEDPGRYARDWLRWWEANQERYLPEDGEGEDGE